MRTALRGIGLSLIVVVAFLVLAAIDPYRAGYAAGGVISIIIQGAILAIPLLAIAGLWWLWRRRRPLKG